MSIQVQNAYIAYGVRCSVCLAGLSVNDIGEISVDADRHLKTADCPCCESTLSIYYSKEDNQILATRAELQHLDMSRSETNE